MKFVNKVCGNEEISDKIRQIIEPLAETENGDLPLAIVTRYIKDEKTGQLTPHFMAGALEYPVVLFNEPDEGDNMLYLAMKYKFFAYKKQGEEGNLMKGHMFFPKTSTIVNVNKEWENYEKGIPNEKVQISENTVELMIFESKYFEGRNYNFKKILDQTEINKELQDRERRK